MSRRRSKKKGASRPSKGQSKGAKRQSKAALKRWLWPGLVLLAWLLAAWIVTFQTEDNFRLPKLLVSELLGLASLVLLSFRLWRIEKVEWRPLLRHPVVRAALPLFAVASLGLWTSSRPEMVRSSLASLAIALACLVGWSLALRSRQLALAGVLLLVPAAWLAVLVVLQFHDIYRPFIFERGISERLSLTSRAGGAFDLAGYLVLPCLVAQVLAYRIAVRWRDSGGAVVWLQRLAILGALGLSLYGMAVTQTMAALVALAAGSVVFWFLLLPRRRFAMALGVLLLGAAGMGLGVEPLRERLLNTARQLGEGRVEAALTGRTDGWKAAGWMLAENPWAGVGHGAYRGHFGTARIDLVASGERFYAGHRQPFFINAHNDFLEAAAEWGIPGLVVLAWSIWQLLAAGRSKMRLLAAAGEPAQAALVPAALIACGVLAAVWFPFHLALIAYPYLLFFSWIFSHDPELAR